MSNEMDAINALSDDEFVARFGFLFENSPWVVEDATEYRPFATRDAMYSALMAAMYDAYGDDDQLSLLRAHPKLADKAAIDAGLTKESTAEQASAGLDHLTPEEFAEFQQLNDAYEWRFHFPFIICVRLAGGKASILQAMRSRLHNSRDTERATALAEVGKIVRLRLEDALP